jgi:hypothetical protein
VTVVGLGRLFATSADAFAVSWHEQSIQVEPRTVPTFPGFHGGAP